MEEQREDLLFLLRKYEYQKLPMGLCNSPDIFQEKMSTLLGDLEYVRTYIDDLLITTKSDWQDHLHHLDIIFHRLREAGLKINVKKFFFGKKNLNISDIGFLDKEFSRYQRKWRRSKILLHPKQNVNFVNSLESSTIIGICGSDDLTS